MVEAILGRTSKRTWKRRHTGDRQKVPAQKLHVLTIYITLFHNLSSTAQYFCLYTGKISKQFLYCDNC